MTVPSSIDMSSPQGKKSKVQSLPFPSKLMAILSNKEHEDIIGWMVDGNGFMIHQKKLFETQVIPQYYQKPTKYSSFTRKLSRWGFRRVPGGPLMGMYYHPLFKKDHPQLCKRIHCVPTLSDGVLNPFETSDNNATIYDKKGRAIDLGKNENDDQMQSSLSQYQGMLSASQGMLSNQMTPAFASSSSTTRAQFLDQALRQNMPGVQPQNIMNRVMQGGNAGQSFMSDPSFLLNNGGMNLLQHQNQGPLLQPPLPQTMPMNQSAFNPLDLLGNSRIMPYDMSFNNRRNMPMDLICGDEERRLLQQASSGRAAVSNRIRELDTLLAASRRGTSEQLERHAPQSSHDINRTHPSFMR